MIKATKKINGVDFTFEFDNKDLKENLVSALSFLKFDKCTCGSDKIYWTGYRTKEGYLYVKRVCATCKKESYLSQNQSTKDYFWKDWEESKWEENQDVKIPPKDDEPDIKVENIPF